MAATDVYTLTEASPGGIGKVYEGREVSFVMGHQGAGWLDRPTLEAEERTDLVLDNLPLDEDDVVADIGAGIANVQPLLATGTDPRLPPATVGLEWVETKDVLPRQHFMVFRKP